MRDADTFFIPHTYAWDKKKVGSCSPKYRVSFLIRCESGLFKQKSGGMAVGRTACRVRFAVPQHAEKLHDAPRVALLSPRHVHHLAARREAAALLSTAALLFGEQGGRCHVVASAPNIPSTPRLCKIFVPSTAARCPPITGCSSACSPGTSPHLLSCTTVVSGSIVVRHHVLAR